MQFNQGAGVFNAQGEEVGRVDRVVLDPRTRKVTHIVVHRGILFTEDKVVPIDKVESASTSRVTLRADAPNFRDLPNFEEMHYVRVSEEERSRFPDRDVYTAPLLYWYPAYGVPAMAYPGTVAQPYVIRTQENIPEGTVALKEGARVVAADGRRVGNIERVLTEPIADRASHFVISSGVLQMERKLVPLTWVDRVQEDEVHLAVGSRILYELREYSE